MSPSIHQALYIINRHAKSAKNPKPLYDLKQVVIEKLLREKKAVKIGIHEFFGHTFMTLIQINQYYFHIMPGKRDKDLLPFLGHVSWEYHNPKSQMPLREAKAILTSYINQQHECQQSFISNYLNG